MKVASEKKTQTNREDFFGLRYKKILITGASKGLGQVCAKAFADRGAKLLLAARSADRLKKIKAALNHTENHNFFVGDLTKRDEITKLEEAAIAFGDIDVILHVMGGGLGLRDPLLAWDAFELLFKTNLASAAEINRLMIPKMIERKTGNIIHVISLAGEEAVGSVGYNSIKAALAAYTRSLGRELATTGTIVTGILPGSFWAPENSWVRFKNKNPELLEKIIAEKQPRKIIGQADEIIPLMLFLASRKATMMRGCCVPIDGGEGLGYIL